MMKPSQIAAIVAALTMRFGETNARAPDYPGSRTIRIIVPYPPGASDLLARATAEIASRKYGYSIIVENRPGAGTALGTRVVKQADPDGYTILFQATNLLNNLHTMKDPGYALSDFQPVGLLGRTSYVLMVRSSLPVSNLKEFVETARAKNGALNYASLGHGTRQQLLPEHLKVEGKFDWKEIPYKGGMEAVQAIISDQVEGFFATVSLAQAQQKAPQLRLLAIASEARSPFLPDVPTFKELGYSDVSDQTWFALFVRSDTPQPIIGKLRSVFGEVVKMPEMADALKKISIEPLDTTFDKFVADTDVTNKKLAAEQVEFKIEKQ